jgi:transposase InsO family protein
VGFRNSVALRIGQFCRAIVSSVSRAGRRDRRRNGLHPSQQALEVKPRPLHLDHVLVFGRRHLEQILRGYVTHYNAERPHRSLALAAPAGEPHQARGSPAAGISRRDVLGGLIHEYYAAAA